MVWESDQCACVLETRIFFSEGDQEHIRTCDINKMAYFYAACSEHVTIFSTGDNFRSVLNFT